MLKCWSVSITHYLYQYIYFSVKNRRSGLNIFILLPYFYFIFDLVSLIPLLELGLGLEQQGHVVTQQVTSDNTVRSHMTYERG